MLMYRYTYTGRCKPPGFDVLWNAGWLQKRQEETMIAVCPKCGTIHETTTEDACSPEPLDRMCVQCYRNTLDEAAAARAEARGDIAGARQIRANAAAHWRDVDTYERIRAGLLGAR